MAEDLLPLVGFNMDPGEDDSSDSEDDYNFDEPGHEDPDAEDVDSNSDDEETEDPKSPAPNITFDKFLPGTHSYLGNDLEDLRGRTVHDEESLQNIPLLSLPGVVLVPGQTLPLHLFQPSTVAMVRRLVDGDKTFGLVTSRYMGHEYGQTLASIGTTAEILAIKEETDDASGVTTVRVKAMGRQRFEIKETQRQIDGVMVGKVRILPERVLPPVLDGATPGSYVRTLRSQIPNTETDSGSEDHKAILQQWLATNKPTRKKIDRFTSANFTWWPPWVYKQYDPKICMELVKKELRSWNETLKEENMPADVSDFSFWVAGNLPLDDGLKLHLMRMDSAVQRLRCELNIMQRCTVLCCKECGLMVANKNDVFSMAVEGPMGAFVNPGGYVHETFTVYKAQGINLVGRPSTQHSWFPGYAWTIIQCRNCNQHMGWKFTTTKKKLQPEKFWGLCRSSVYPGLQSDDENNADWAPTHFQM